MCFGNSNDEKVQNQKFKFFEMKTTDFNQILNTDSKDGEPTCVVGQDLEK